MSKRYISHVKDEFHKLAVLRRPELEWGGLGMVSLGSIAAFLGIYSLNDAQSTTEVMDSFQQVSFGVAAQYLGMASTEKAFKIQEELKMAREALSNPETYRLIR
jgi:hypothetical protein